MPLWSDLVDAIGRLIESVGAALGGTAAGILAVTLLLRLALIPIMLPLAVRARERQKIVAAMRPEMRELKQLYRKEPDRLQKEIEALHARHGIKVIDGPGLLGALVQLPVLIALFQAVYKVSEGTTLAEGGLLIGAAAAAASAFSVVLAGQGDSKPMLALSAVLPVAISGWLGRGIALYLLAFYAGSAIQGLLMRRRQPAMQTSH